jgi:hypothetical protein
MDRFGDWFVDAWVDFALSVSARVGLVICLVIYWGISAYGVAQIKGKYLQYLSLISFPISVGLSSEKLFLDDSPLLELVRLQSNIIFKEGGQMAVFFNNPGDLSKPDAIPNIMRILEHFEHAHGAVGSSSTQMWLAPYLPYIGLQNHGSIDFKYKYLPEFFGYQEYRRWSHYVNLGAAQ